MQVVFKTLAVAGLTAVCIACSHDSATENGTRDVSGPYGVWTWNDAYVLVVLKNNQYIFCDSSVCFERPVDISNPNYVWLEDFYREPLATKFGLEAFRGKTAFDASRSAVAASERPFDLDFSSRQPLSNSLRSRCSGVPCVFVGHLEEGAVFTRVVDFSN